MAHRTIYIPVCETLAHVIVFTFGFTESAPPHSFHVQVQALRGEIRAAYSEILAMDPEFSASKDVELLLWKNCYYKRIEVSQVFCVFVVAVVVCLATLIIACIPTNNIRLVSRGMGRANGRLMIVAVR